MSNQKDITFSLIPNSKLPSHDQINYGTSLTIHLFNKVLIIIQEFTVFIHLLMDSFVCNCPVSISIENSLQILFESDDHSSPPGEVHIVKS